VVCSDIHEKDRLTMYTTMYGKLEAAKIRIDGPASHKRLTAKEVAAFLGTTENVLQQWRNDKRCPNRGPQFATDGRFVWYTVAWLEEWLNYRKPWARKRWTVSRTL
jgi:hypothetical protein